MLAFVQIAKLELVLERLRLNLFGTLLQGDVEWGASALDLASYAETHELEHNFLLQLYVDFLLSQVG